MSIKETIINNKPLINKLNIKSLPPLFIIGTDLSGKKFIADYIEKKYQPVFRICKQFTSDINIAKQYNSKYHVYYNKKNFIESINKNEAISYSLNTPYFYINNKKLLEQVKRLQNLDYKSLFVKYKQKYKLENLDYNVNNLDIKEAIYYYEVKNSVDLLTNYKYLSEEDKQNYLHYYGYMKEPIQMTIESKLGAIVLLDYKQFKFINKNKSFLKYNTINLLADSPIAYAEKLYNYKYSRLFKENVDNVKNISNKCFVDDEDQENIIYDILNSEVDNIGYEIKGYYSSDLFNISLTNTYDSKIYCKIDEAINYLYPDIKLLIEAYSKK